MLDQLVHAVERPAQLPERGNYPKELLALGVKEYRQVSFKPYRAIYRVIVYLIADGRRDIRSVLARRLLGA